MAHTIDHPFGGGTMTSCSYGAQAVAKAAKTVKPTKVGKPMTQTDLATLWIKDFANQVDGPIVKWTKKSDEGKNFAQVVSKEGDSLKFEIYTDGKLIQTNHYSSNPAETLKWQAQSKADFKWKSEWQYPADASDGLGVTEAAFEKANLEGSWQAVTKKMFADELEPGDIVATGLGSFDDTMRIVYEGQGKFRLQTLVEGKGNWVTIVKDKDVYQMEKYMTPGNGLEIKWKYATTKGSPPAVAPQSTSIGAMTDEDAATLFVQIKDGLAAKRGLNIKGVNKGLDFQVYDKIAELTGYTPSEIFAKVERYKKNGNKLSALKKKTLGKGKTLDATKFAKKETVDQAVEDLNDPKVFDTFGIYKDEDVAKAYIKAKDHIASLDDNPWTLYTNENSVPAFEKAIRAYMKSEYNVDVDSARLKKQLTDYIASDGKLSSLKKKMVKAGEMEKKADTLKGGGQFEKVKNTSGDDTVQVGKKTFKKNANDPTAEQLADLGYTPNGAKVHSFSPLEEESLYSSVKPGTYLSNSPEDIYEKLLTQQAKLAKEGKDVSILDLVRAFDRVGAKKFNAENAFLYEKKLADWASSPAGKKYIKDKWDAEQIRKNMPDLPADSSMFREISTSEATQMQSEMLRWTAQEKESLRHYTGSAYTSMNGALRGNSLGQGNNKMHIINAWKGMRPSNRDIILHRGTSMKAFGNAVQTEADLYKLVGDTFVEKGFSSTSVGGRSAFGGNVILEIEAPKGTLMAYVDNISLHRGENEMMLPPNTHFKVLKVEKKGYQTVVRVRVVHTEAYKG